MHAPVADVRHTLAPPDCTLATRWGWREQRIAVLRGGPPRTAAELLVHDAPAAAGATACNRGMWVTYGNATTNLCPAAGSAAGDLSGRVGPVRIRTRGRGNRNAHAADGFCCRGFVGAWCTRISLLMSNRFAGLAC